MTINRRNFVTAASAALGLTGCARTARRPNILLIIADDQSFPHASAYGFSAVRTPAFDRIAKEGALFTRAYTACPSCTPSRSALLTGRPIWQLGEAGVLYGTMPPDLKLFPHLLAGAGYHTGFTGKGWAPGDWKAAGLQQHPCGREYNAVQLDPPPEQAGLDVRDMAGNFRAFLKDRPAGAPFCFWAGSTEPHRAYEQGAGLKRGKRLEQAQVPAWMPDTPELRGDLLDYYSEIEWFDAQVGRLLEALGPEIDNTAVIITSDNGMPFPRAKANLYEAGTHMPLAIRWGKAGQQLDEFVSHIDLAPTILEIAGVPVPPEMRGRSLKRLLEEGIREPARDQVYLGLERHTICRPDFAGYPMRAIRAERYLYIRNFEPRRWPTGGDFLSSNKTTHGDIDAGPAKDIVLASARHRDFTIAQRPPEELYDVVADPDQMKNLIADPSHQNIVEKLRGRLSAYLRTTKDPRAEGRDPWRDYPYRQTVGYGASFNTALPEAARKAARERSTHKPE